MSQNQNDPILIEVIASLNTFLETDKINENSELGNPPEWDSLNHIEVLALIEKKYNITMGAYLVAQLFSVKKIAEFVEKEKSKA